MKMETNKDAVLLNREAKLLFLHILRKGWITRSDADKLAGYLKSVGLSIPFLSEDDKRKIIDSL